MPASCRARTMALNSCTCCAGGRVAGVLVVRGEEADRVVAPVVAQALLLRAVSSCTNWCTGMSSRAVMPRSVRYSIDRRVRDAGVGAAQLLGDAAGCVIGQALDVGLVDHRLVVRRVRRPVDAPVEVRVDDDGLRHVRRRVVVVALLGRRSRSRTPTGPSRSGRRSPWRTGRAAACSGCSAGPASGSYGPVHAEAVALAGLDAGQEGVPDEAVHLGQLGSRSSLPSSSNRHSSTLSATSLKIAKLVPVPSYVAPSG